MATYTHDLAIKTGEYTDREGRTKNRWLNVGKVFKHDDGGISIKLDALPVGLVGWEGWISVFPRREGDSHVNQYHGMGNSQQPPQKAAQGGGQTGSQLGLNNEDIPF